MAVFSTTLSQTVFLFSFIIIGYLLSRWKLVPSNSQTVLSKLENYLFIPALVLGTFMENFTLQQLRSAGGLLTGSVILAAFAVILAHVCAHLCTKDKYVQKISIYGLCFANFGYMGNAVVSALFPDLFMEYLIFTLPLWILIYLWAVPVLLIGSDSGKQTVAQRLKNFANPMFTATVLGMLIGLINIPIPKFINTAVNTAGSCMSPIAMLLTGMTIAQFNLREILQIKSVYLITALRLLVFPLLFLGAMLLIPMEKTMATCAICALSMPLGLNTIVIPSALGKDTKVASGMALVSHVLSCITIPVILALFAYVSV